MRIVLTLLCLFTMSSVAPAGGGTLRVGVAQIAIEDTLEANLTKTLRFIGQASESRCDLVVFPEHTLYWPHHPPEVSHEVPTKADLDAAIEQIRRAAKKGRVAVAFGEAYPNTNGERFAHHSFVFGPDGELLQKYWKSREVPRPFDLGNVRCNLLICSDRWYLEQSDLPSLVGGAQLIIDTSGGHGGDDGAPDLRWVRYRPWAARNGAWVVVANPVHDDTDFMGRSPWGGGSAVIRPDGTVQTARVHQKDELTVTEIDVEAATREGAERRRRHPLLREFWDLGEKLLAGESIEATPELAPYESAVRDIKIAAAQIESAGDLAANTRKIATFIERAARDKADIVVFPELALTGRDAADVRSAAPEAIDQALRSIQDTARAHGIYVIVGAPLMADGVRRNAAIVIDDHGTVLTRYAQIAADRSDLFGAAQSAHAMWFSLKGVPSIVTIGADADWVEIGDLAANRGMSLHFHISSETDASAEAALLRKQRYILALANAQFGAAVNTAEGGGSLIVSREGGHQKPPPAGLEHYLPYQTSIVRAAGAAETILYATRRTSAHNPQDLARHWRNRSRKTRQESGWYEWIKAGTRLIEADASPGQPH